MLDLGYSLGQEVDFRLDENATMIVKVTDFNKGFHVADRDEVFPGLCLLNSEEGLMSFGFSVSYFRLVCSNSLISSVSSGVSRFRHVNRRAIENLSEIIRATADEFGREQSRMKMSVNTPVHDVPDSISGFVRRFGLTQSEGEQVKAAWANEPVASLWGIINAFTFAAKSAELPDAYRLERVGGQILSLVKNN